MMIHAYQEMYLNKAQSVLGDVFDYAVNACGVSGGEFAKMFVVSTLCERMEHGEPECLAGKSGVEITREVLAETKGQEIDIEPQDCFERSKEYWIGWAIAYYQWYSGRKYSDIFKVISFEELQKMYYTFHEADITRFVDAIDARVKEHFSETNLKRFRATYGLTQAELAKRSGVSIRSIQMYEQRNKDINKASAETLYRLAKVLGCTMEDLVEK